MIIWNMSILYILYNYIFYNITCIIYYVYVYILYVCINIYIQYMYVYPNLRRLWVVICKSPWAGISLWNESGPHHIFISIVHWNIITYISSCIIYSIFFTTTIENLQTKATKFSLQNQRLDGAKHLSGSILTLL